MDDLVAQGGGVGPHRFYDGRSVGWEFGNECAVGLGHAIQQAGYVSLLVVPATPTQPVGRRLNADGSRDGAGKKRQDNKKERSESHGSLQSLILLFPERRVSGRMDSDDFPVFGNPASLYAFAPSAR